jgi:hypothetical protein
VTVPRPSILTPVGGSVINCTNVDISWLSPSLTASQIASYTFEILTTLNLDAKDAQNSKWIVIASVPAQSTSFSWLPPSYLNSNSVHIGVRLVSSNGFRSEISFNRSAVSIYGFELDQIEVLEPIAGQELNGSFFIKLNLGRMKSTHKYVRLFVNFSSQSLGIYQFPILDSVRLLDRYSIDLSRIGNCDDGMISLYTRDSANRISSAVNIEKLKIRNTGTFVLDTIGPDLSIELAQGALYVNSKDIIAKLYAFDETTSVSSCKFNIFRYDNGQIVLDYEGEPRQPFLDNVITLPEGDGVKNVAVTAIDVGCNKPREIMSTIKTVQVLSDSSNFFELSTQSSIVSVEPYNTGFRLYKITDSRVFLGFVPSKPIAISEFEGLYYFSLEDIQQKMHVAAVSPVGVTDVFVGTTTNQVAVKLAANSGGVFVFDQTGNAFRISTGVLTSIGFMGGPVSSVRFLKSGNLAVSVGNFNKIVIVNNTSIVQVVTL